MQSIASVRLVFDRKHLATKKRKGLVQLEILYNGRRKWMTTGIKLYADQWSDRLHACNTVHMLEYNETLDTLVASAQKYINDGIRSGMAFSFDGLAAHLAGPSGSLSLIDFIEERIEKGGDLQASTKKTHRTLLNALRAYGKIVDFRDVTVAALKGFDDWLHAKGYKQTTVYGYHKRLKRYINDAIRYDYMTRNPYSKLSISRGRSETVKYLLKEEIDRIEGCAIQEPSIARARDLFIFQCYTGLAYSDMAQFDFADCELRDGSYIIKDTRQKTGGDYFVVLLKPAMRVLRRYGNRLPVISNQKYNQYLKIVALYAGVDKPITSHWGRHSYAVMALSLGVRMEHISKMLGHTSTRITESTYAKVLGRDIIEDFGRLDKKIK